MKTAKMNRKIFVFTVLPDDLLQRVLHMPVMGPFPIDIAADAAPQELFMRMENIIGNEFPDVVGPARALKLAVTADTTPPGNPVEAAEMCLHLRQLVNDMIRGDEDTPPRGLAPDKAGIPRNDCPSLFPGKPDDLPVVQAAIIEHIIPEQSQPCGKPPEHCIGNEFH